MRLIDADTLIKDLSYLYTKNHIPVDMRAKGILTTIMEQPTAYDVDKVVEQLETARDGYSTAKCMTATNTELVKRFIAKEKAMNLAIEIVKAGGSIELSEHTKSQGN